MSVEKVLCRGAIALLALFIATGQALADGATPGVLEGRAWTIELYFDGKTMVSSRQAFGGPGRIRFIGQRIEGSPGCGGFIGGYSMTAEEIRIRAGVLLAGSCWDRERRIDTWPLNRPVLDALNRVRTVEPLGNGYLLQDATGETQVILMPYEAP